MDTGGSKEGNAKTAKTQTQKVIITIKQEVNISENHVGNTREEKFTETKM